MVFPVHVFGGAENREKLKKKYVYIFECVYIYEAKQNGQNVLVKWALTFFLEL